MKVPLIRGSTYRAATVEGLTINMLILFLCISPVDTILLYGSDNYDRSVNKIILSIFINFITESKRFDDPLMQC